MDTRRKEREMKRNKRMTAVLSGISVIFAISWLPYHAYLILTDIFILGVSIQIFKRVTYVCHLCLSLMFATYVCNLCLLLSFVTVLCLSLIFVTYVCHLYLSLMLVTYVWLTIFQHWLCSSFLFVFAFWLFACYYFFEIFSLSIRFICLPYLFVTLFVTWNIFVW